MKRLPSPGVEKKRFFEAASCSICKFFFFEIENGSGSARGKFRNRRRGLTAINAVENSRFSYILSKFAGGNNVTLLRVLGTR